MHEGHSRVNPSADLRADVPNTSNTIAQARYTQWCILPPVKQTRGSLPLHSNTVAMGDFAVHHSEINLCRADIFGCNLVQVFVDDDDICQLPDLQ